MPLERALNEFKRAERAFRQTCATEVLTRQHDVLALQESFSDAITELTRVVAEQLRAEMAKKQ